MVVIAIITLVLLGIYVILGSIRQHRLLFNKFVVIVAVIAIGILVLQGSLSKNDPQQVEIPPYQKIAPSVQQAPYVVQTSSRAYYVTTFKDSEDVLLLINYYFYSRKNWELADIPLPLDRSIYGNLKVVKRNIGG